MIRVTTGLPGSGKSCDTALTITKLLHRNEKWYEECVKLHAKDPEFYPRPEKRVVYSNVRLNTDAENIYPGFIQYWVDPAELVSIRDADVVWDEIATHLDATQWANMSLELKRWLQQHRKFGIEIYGNTQDFAMVDISMRRLVSDLFWLTKIIGSRDPSPTTPPVKHIWGIVIRRRLDPQKYAEDKKEAQGIFDLSFMWIGRKLTDLFDTRQEIKMGMYPPLRHIERECERCALGTCTHKKVVHV